MQDKDLYVIAVLRYKEKNNNLKEDNLFPLDWNSSTNYHLKVEIIAEAIKKNILIKDTELYNTKFNNNRCKTLTNIPRNGI